MKNLVIGFFFLLGLSALAKANQYAVTYCGTDSGYKVTIGETQTDGEVFLNGKRVDELSCRTPDDQPWKGPGGTTGWVQLRCKGESSQLEVTATSAPGANSAAKMDGALTVQNWNPLECHWANRSGLN